MEKSFNLPVDANSALSEKFLDFKKVNNLLSNQEFNLDESSKSDLVNINLSRSVDASAGIADSGFDIRFDPLKQSDINAFHYIILHEGNLIKPWKLALRISARIIEIYEDTITLECLIDKEEAIYEERVFDIEDFRDFELYIGKVFKLVWYRRPRELKLEIVDNPSLISEDDFPKTNFAERYKNIKLTKK